MMKLLHHELREAREKAGMTQQELARRAGIPRNQIVRAERGENITIDTLRKIAAFLPLTELSLLDTTGLRVDIIPEPERLFMAAVTNVVQLTHALKGAIDLAMEARSAVEIARRATPPVPGVEPTPAAADPIFFLRNLQRIAGEIETISREAKIAS